MFKKKILIFFKRYDHDNNKILKSKNLSFLSIISFIVIIRSLKFIIENDLNENSFDINHSKNVSNKKKLTNKKRSILTLKTFKKNKIQKFNLIDIAEINAFAYYHLIKNKKNKLFSLIINKIYDIFIQSFEIELYKKRDNRISINKLCSCGSAIKYKKCYEFYTSIRVNLTYAIYSSQCVIQS